MVDIQKFRVAFHGFNRDDVVQFLEAEQAKHSMEINSLQDNIKRLEEALATAKTAQAQPVAQLEQLQAENAALREQLEELETRPAPEAPQAVEPSDSNLRDQELEAYRRAENVERQARIRASQMSTQVHTLVDDISNRMDGTQAEMTAAADDLGQALERLQAALDHSRAALHDGAAAFRALQPEQD